MNLNYDMYRFLLNFYSENSGVGPNQVFVLGEGFVKGDNIESLHALHGKPSSPT